jgi:hypothetical protein
MFVKSLILLDEILLILGQVIESMNRVRSACRNTGAAVDATLGIYIHLSRSFEAGLVLLGMDAVGGADFDAEGVLNAGIGNYISHDESISRMK